MALKIYCAAGGNQYVHDARLFAEAALRGWLLINEGFHERAGAR